jgi:hypothetical protein
MIESARRALPILVLVAIAIGIWLGVLAFDAIT